MPKEWVQDSNNWHVVTTWNANGWVQLAVEAPDQIRRSIEMLRGVGYDVVPLGAQPRNVSELAEKVEEMVGPTGWGTMHATFEAKDRPAVNALINHMRVARDRAFGKDA